jgi:hypothetical protein
MRYVPTPPSPEQLAHYLEQRGALSKPWMLQPLRLSKLKAERESMDPHVYLLRVQEAHADLMRLREFWKGRETELFGAAYRPAEVIEPLPGSAEDR